MLRILKSNWFLAALTLVLGALVAPDVFAQAAANTGVATAQDMNTGPFAKFLARAGQLFQASRNALFVVAAFFFGKFAFDAISKGKVEWEQILYLLIGLVLLGVAGFIVSYMANPQGSPDQIQRQYNIEDKGGWGNN